MWTYRCACGLYACSATLWIAIAIYNIARGYGRCLPVRPLILIEQPIATRTAEKAKAWDVGASIILQLYVRFE